MCNLRQVVILGSLLFFGARAALGAGPDVYVVRPDIGGQTVITHQQDGRFDPPTIVVHPQFGGSVPPFGAISPSYPRALPGLVPPLGSDGDDDADDGEDE